MSETAFGPNEPPLARAAAHALLALVGAAVLLWLVTHVGQRDFPGTPVIPLTFEGEHYRLGAEEVDWLAQFSTLHFSAGGEAAKAIVAAEVGARLDRIFAHASTRIPEYADWYYSLEGEYSRAAMALLALADLADAGYAADRAARMLLPEEVWTEDLAALERRTAERLAAHHAAIREGWLAEVTSRLASHRVPAPLEGAASADAVRVMLDDLLADIVAHEQTSLTTRLSLSTLAAGGAAATPALLRAARGGASTGRAAAARTAARGASRAGTAAIGGAAVCAVGGPLAAGCAVVAGAAAWLATDWVLLRVDERLHREELERTIGTGLASLRARIEADLLATYDELIAAHYAAVQSEIERSFVPARSGAPQPR